MSEHDRSHERRRSDWKRNLLAVAAVSVTLLIFYEAMVFRGQEPISGDTAATEAHFRWVEERRDTGDDRMPLWYPHIFLGMPSYGSFIHTPGSPLSWVHRTTNMNRGTRYVVWFSIGAMGAVLLARRFDASATAAFVAAFSVVLTPYVVGSLNAGHSSKLMAMAFAPLVLWSVDTLTSRGGVLNTGLTAMAVALQLWSNHPQIVYYTWLIVGPYALVKLAVRRDRATLARTGLLAAALVIALLMATLPYLPVLEYAKQSTRGAPTVLPGAAASGTQSWEYATLWSFHPKELISLVVPGFFGLEGATYWGPMPFTQSTHALGTIPLALAVVGFCAMRGWRRRFFLVMAGVILVVGFGRYVPILYRPLYEMAPFFDKFRVPSMIYSMLPLLAAPAIAVGFDSVANRVRQCERATKAVLAATAFLIVAGVVVAGGAGATGSEGWLMKDGEQASSALVGERHDILSRDLLRVGIIGTIAAVAALVRLRGRLSRPMFASATVALLIVDLVTLGRAFYRPQPKTAADDLGPDPGVVAMLRDGEHPTRVLPLELSVRDGRLSPSLLEGSEYAVAGIQSVGGYHAAGLRRMKDFILAGLWANPALWPALDVDFVTVHVRARLTSEQRLQLQEVVAAEFAGLELLGARSTLAGEVFVLRNPANLGRVFMVPKARVVPDALERIEQLGAPTFEPGEEVLLESDVAAPDLPRAAWDGSAALVSYTDERVEIRTRGDGGYVVVADAYHDGWEATVDGDERAILPANHVVRAIIVPPGEHTVVLTFRDPAYDRATLLSTTGKAICGTFLLAGAFLAWRRPSDRRA